MLDEAPNQSPPFVDVNLFATDTALREAVVREGAGHAVRQLEEFGALCGSAEAFEQGRLANEYPPRLRTHDAQGRRIDFVEFHPAYHACMAQSMGAGLHCGSWERSGNSALAVNVARAAAFYMTAQMEAGHCCPITMTNAAVPTLRLQPEIADEWVPRILSRDYDPTFRPAAEKSSITIGMGMTEKQGGTDVRANTTRAEPVASGGPGGEYILTGHKWFFSAPMSDAFLVLAQTRGGLSCFFVPRHLPDGTINALRLQRLKDKLGNRSNASAEVEFHGAHAWLIGEEGRGVPAIIEMVTYTRLDCAVSSAGLMRLALAMAVHHAQHRSVFGRKLIDHALMTQVLADMALDVEAATALVFRLARSFDHPEDVRAAAWRRLMTPVTKFWVCKVAPMMVGEAMECLGGNGYVEEHGLARIYREVPVNSIWEGSGNVMALDVLRVLQKEPEVAQIVMHELAEGVADDRKLEAAYERLVGLLHDPRMLDVRARELTELMALTAAGMILRSQGDTDVADAFISTRLSGPPNQTYGQGLERANTTAILRRVLPS
ncbi:MAG: isovaleryl-CoA dehydrogenase [Proteobacteria bacterium]|jgi:putative acyl-CoA dehydrogenase|nr:MAG: isovaleryl-CoA dehydrogenase [Pseudomonadota bacterium]